MITEQSYSHSEMYHPSYIGAAKSVIVRETGA